MNQVATTKLSSKGQVVIPEEIRKRLRLEPGDQFVVVGEGNVVILQTVEPPRPEDLKALMDEVQAAAKAAGIVCTAPESSITCLSTITPKIAEKVLSGTLRLSTSPHCAGPIRLTAIRRTQTAARPINMSTRSTTTNRITSSSGQVPTARSRHAALRRPSPATARPAELRSGRGSPTSPHSTPPDSALPGGGDEPG